MSTEELKTAIRRYYDEAVNKGIYEVIDELFSRDFVLEDPMVPALQGRGALKGALCDYHEAFPDGRSIVEDIIVEGNKVAVRGYRLGTQQGEYMGIAPTNKTIRVPFMDIWQLSDNEFIRGWSLTHALGLLEQLGIASPVTVTEVYEEYIVS